ncbi:MAG: hypothetical protein ACYCQI_10880 [Gammaproteobacteria bacterium]
MAEPYVESETAYVSLEDSKKENKKKSSFASLFKCCLSIFSKREKKGMLDDQVSPVVTRVKGSINH